MTAGEKKVLKGLIALAIGDLTNEMGDDRERISNAKDTLTNVLTFLSQANDEEIKHGS